jgi:hypothetical protein
MIEAQRTRELHTQRKESVLLLLQYRILVSLRSHQHCTPLLANGPPVVLATFPVWSVHF